MAEKYTPRDKYTKQGQVLPDDDWILVRAYFPGRSAVRVIDAESRSDQFLLLDPRPDCTDIDLDGQVLAGDEAGKALAGHRTEPLPRFLQEQIKPSWPTE